MQLTMSKPREPAAVFKNKNNLECSRRNVCFGQFEVEEVNCSAMVWLTSEIKLKRTDTTLDLSQKAKLQNC